MDQQPNVSLESSTKPSKLMALIALVIAFALPFILVKSFPHKHKTSYSPTDLALPESGQSSIIPPIVAQEIATERKPASSINAVKPSQNDRIANAPPKTKMADKQPSVEVPKPEANPKKALPAKVAAQNNDWKIIKTRSGDSLTTVFKRLGLSPQTLQAIMRGNPHAKALSQLKTDQEIQLLIKKQTLEKMILPYTNLEELVVVREGQRYKTKILTRKTTSQNHIVAATVHGSLYGTAKRNNIPYKLVQQMTEIFTWDINFAKDIRAGDQFIIMYQALYVGDKLVGAGDILAVKYKTRGRTYEAIRHTDRRGHSDYYSLQGTSLKKAFERYPLRFSHISSPFSLSRYHPILHYRRPHKGVDLAAPIGTPIRATGDGRIEIIGRQSGYGNMIKINHNKTYSTIYGHMLKFQKGLSRGDFVKRGQIIGYVGQTGLASGPHCHYEFHINRQPKNPTTVNLPRGFPIEAREMASFKANSAKLLAQLKLFEQTRLAKS
ncbi:peptidase, M23/M37 family [Legionella lansingensis]|uniref:M23/M37 family transporter peptidase n=1 Tax=Legionella lansingensis TaxID=45067 RepID=A0A0W0VPN2_9GAMM|nr:peptidoglycan DD-metalloendopeptidase family protein [Legionella lansingensis]KTD22117.1 M23/M37 family transporter peptidase [Legionella lansingensis]SNV54292.1 peptidase, M23/M37 family [Legionella lansingensis]